MGGNGTYRNCRDFYGKCPEKSGADLYWLRLALDVRAINQVSNKGLSVTAIGERLLPKSWNFHRLQDLYIPDPVRLLPRTAFLEKIIAVTKPFRDK
jgi:hypothetical protein